MSLSARKLLAASWFALLIGCANRPLRVPRDVAPLANAADVYLDLQPGWRLRAILPVLRDGAMPANPVQAGSVQGNQITLSAAKDFLGYETEYFQVAHSGPGVRISFASGTITTTEPLATEQTSANKLPELVRLRGFVRLVYLERSSTTEHDMVVIATRHQSVLEEATATVRGNPEACQNVPEFTCIQLPPHVALRAEKRAMNNGVLEWVPR